IQNDACEFVDLHVPRKCSASNRIIGAKDHASIRMNLAEVGRVTGWPRPLFKAGCEAEENVFTACRRSWV
uniref:40S ribosomal protein S21 n=1 Tax=Peromyscus maniculatus bairdii TaxID=230844 RepID=A0A8C8TZH7_PERMB